MIPIVELADANTEPRTVMIVPFNTVIASLTVNGAKWPVNTALDAVLLIYVESAADYHIFMFRDVEMVDRRDQCVFLIPFVLVHDLRDDAGIGVNTAKERVKGDKLKNEQQGREIIGMVVSVEEIAGEK